MNPGQKMVNDQHRNIFITILMNKFRRFGFVGTEPLHHKRREYNDFLVSFRKVGSNNISNIGYFKSADDYAAYLVHLEDIKDWDEWEELAEITDNDRYFEVMTGVFKKGKKIRSYQQRNWYMIFLSYDFKHHGTTEPAPLH